MPKTIEEITQEHPNEWLAIEVTKSNGAEPLEGIFLDHDPDAGVLHYRVPPSKDKSIALLFNGPALPDGSEGFMLEVVEFLGSIEPANAHPANRRRDRAWARGHHD